MTSRSDPPVLSHGGGPDEAATAPDAALDARTRSQKRDAGPRVVTSDSLLAGAAELAILHNETTYFLRQTRLGKLILTK